MNVVLQSVVAAVRRTSVDPFSPGLLVADPSSVHSGGTAATQERWTLRGEGLEAAPLGAKAAPTVQNGEDLTTTAN